MTTTEAVRFRYSVVYTLSFVMLLWVIKAMEWALSFDFGIFGIHPRTIEGTFGIITAPLIHGDLMHLISNSFPLILLGVCIFYFYNRIAVEVFFWIYFMTGFWVWIMARDAYHIGASGIVYGLVAFLFFSGLFRKDTRAVAISLIIIFLYGGMCYGVIPSDPRISWESHLMGSVTGIFGAFYFRNVVMPGAAPVVFEDEIEEEEEGNGTLPIAGDSQYPVWTNSAESQEFTFTYTYTEKKATNTDIDAKKTG